MERCNQRKYPAREARPKWLKPARSASASHLIMPEPRLEPSASNPKQVTHSRESKPSGSLKPLTASLGNQLQQRQPNACVAS